MSIQKSIKEEVNEALRSGDKVRLGVLRSISAEITNELVSQKRKPSEELEDSDVLKVISRMVKQRKDSIDQYEKAGRDDLKEVEEKELEILQTYLPDQMSSDEIKKIIEEKIKEVNPQNQGELMKAVMPELKGRADGAEVKRIAEELMSR